MIYQKRILKIIGDYKQYGRDPGKMASWNPRRSAPSIKVKGPSSNLNTEDHASQTPPSSKDMHDSDTSLHRPLAITAFNVAGEHIDTNRSEIFLRPGFKCILELPVDLTMQEAERLKQYVDLMAAK
jgi:hypothetical protein